MRQDTEALKRVYEGIKDFAPDDKNINISEKECQKLAQIYKQIKVPFKNQM